jgi:hypothetical protein
MKDGLHSRGRALENEFFEKQNQHLIEELKAMRKRDESRAELARACGVQDKELLDLLLKNGVNVETLPALVLVPLVAVAWATRKVERAERYAVLEAAADYGIVEGTPGHALLEKWLKVRPAENLVIAWEEYAGQLTEVMDPADRKEFSRSVLRRAEDVANAAGGVLGIGPKTSREEREVLDRLAKALAVKP